MVQISTPGVTPNRGMGPPWGAFCQITLTSCYRCLWGTVLMSSLAADVEIWDQVMFKAHSTHCRVHGIKSWKSNIKRRIFFFSGWCILAHTGQTTSYIKDDVTQSARTQLVAAYALLTPPATCDRKHRPSLAGEHSVWLDHPHGTLCLSLWEGLMVLRLLNAVWKRTFLTSTSALFCFNFHCFIDSYARLVQLVVDLALNTIEHYGFALHCIVDNVRWSSCKCWAPNRWSYSYGMPDHCYFLYLINAIMLFTISIILFIFHFFKMLIILECSL